VATKARLLSTNEESCAVIENELKTAEQTLASVRAQLRERDEQLAALQTVHAQLQIQVCNLRTQTKWSLVKYSAMEDALSSNDETSAELRDVRKRLTDVEHEYELARDALRTATEQQRVSEQVTTRLQQQLEEGAREQQDLAALREQLSLSEQREQEARDIADECRQVCSCGRQFMHVCAHRQRRLHMHDLPMLKNDVE
jgi:chromosome segregation ATPase